MIRVLKKIILLRHKQNILKQKLEENGFKWLKVPKHIIKKYRDTTNKNKDLDNFTIQYKLNREFYSSSTDSINPERDICYYGYLRITKSNKTNAITDIHNSKSNRCGRINLKIKQEMTEIYKSVFTGGKL